MADLDTRSKRASSLRLVLPFVLALPLADGTLSQGDQQHTVCDYSGILAIASTSQPSDREVIVVLPSDAYVVRCPSDDIVLLIPPNVTLRSPVDDVVVVTPAADEDVIL